MAFPKTRISLAFNGKDLLFVNITQSFRRKSLQNVLLMIVVWQFFVK